MRLPSWLIPGGLAALTLGLVYSMRRPVVAVGDIVTVPLPAIGVTIPPTLLLPPNAEIAVQVNAIEGDQVRGNAVGFVDPSTKELKLALPGGGGGLGNLGFAKSAITAIYRGTPAVKIA